jgi:tetratricopeptide (TPR) repeat protein
VPPTIATVRVVDPPIPELAARLRQHNRRASDVVRIQLRAALHAGPVGMDAEGLTGQAVIVAARLLDAPAVKEKLAADQADLVFATSGYVYDHVVRNCVGRVDPAVFEHVECQVKELRVSAWIHVTGRAVPPSGHSGRRSPAGADPRGHGQPPVPGWPGPRPAAAPLGNLPTVVRGRDGLLGELRRALRPYPWRASRTFVIAGMGGLGKSTVALAATKMAQDRGCRVWWVGAADTALLTAGMLEVLRDLRAPESVTAPVREGTRIAPARVWEFLNGEHIAGRRWLLVFDGADNPAVLAGAGSPTPADGTGWLRADPAGMVIVTTRNADPMVWGTGVTLRELKPLDDDAGVQVLRDLAPDVTDRGGREARELSRRLRGLPLALRLAGAYLGSPFARCSSFAEHHRELDGVQLPAAPGETDGPAADLRSIVQRSVDLSLAALAAQERPQARPLLLMLSCLAPAIPIPAWLLHMAPLVSLTAGRAGPGAADHCADSDDERLRGVHEGLQSLSCTGLIEVSDSGGPVGLNAVTVHPVVADASRSWLSTLAAADRAATQRAIAELLEAAAARLDAARPGDWPAWRLLLPHASAAIERLSADLDGAVLARLLTVGAVGTEALLSCRRVAAAERLARACVTAAAFLSHDDPAAMTARGYLARALMRRGRSGEAETLYRDLLTDRCRVQGADHPDTLATRHDLAAAIGLQGRYGEAEQLYSALLHHDHRRLGPGYRHTLAARRNLARMIGRQGRYREAEQLCRQVLAEQRRLLGDTDPDTLATHHSLARIIGMAGRYAEAERMYREVLADRRRILGNDHPDTLSTRHKMARMIGLQGRYAEAEEQCREILDDRHRLFGDDHPDTLAVGHRLAWLIGRQGRYAEAMEMVSRVLGGRRRILGDEHPDTLATRETLAWLTGLRGKLGEAEELCREVLADRRRVLGEDHPDTLTTRATLAWLTGRKGRYADAERQYRDVLAAREAILGPGHPDTLTTRQDMARMIGLQHRYGEAEQLCREVLADRRRVLGDDHPDTLASPAALAWLAARRGRHTEAEALYRQVLADRKRVLGAHHPDTEATRHEFAQLAAGQAPGS